MNNIMDTSHFEKTDVNTVLARLAVEALRENKDPKKVLIRIFIGGSSGGEQGLPLLDALTRVAKIYRNRGIEIVYELITNDKVRNIWRYSCRELFNYLIAADIHLVPTPLSQGMLALGGTDTWSSLNIMDNKERLRFHLGYPCGVFVDDPSGWYDKMGYYKPLMDDGLCAPTLEVDISGSDLRADDIILIQR